MNLPDSILALEGHAVLPTSLWEDVEAVQVSLQGELRQHQDLRRFNHELVVQTEELIQKEAAEDAQFASNLKQAADSNCKIECSVRENMTIMSILDIRPIESVLPSLARPIMSLVHEAGLEEMPKDMKRKDKYKPETINNIDSLNSIITTTYIIKVNTVVRSQN
ncbi:ALIX V-shaped domain-containing protein [Artemisia annua]|uniref:ALIX V-shaped domain-containing protein n=1 Tax=Artemisia annua TaxID=35608 RepID=A0A2U1NZ43_ARTAN|nr:ALIX V-shaped domain-containing protein [Artemisia annua]